MMNTLAQSKSVLVRSGLAARPGRFLLVAANGGEREKVVELVIQLALLGPVGILAGSDWLTGQRIVYNIRRRPLRVQQSLERICLARAFRPLQMADLLADAPPDPHPLLVLDFLHTFCRADAPLPARLRLLEDCCRSLQRLAHSRPVTVLLRPAPGPDYPRFYPHLAALADEILPPARARHAAPPPKSAF